MKREIKYVARLLSATGNIDMAAGVYGEIDAPAV